MENATKALIIAGEVLIGVLILSLASYTFMLFGNYSKNVNAKISETQIREFNVRFVTFEGRANISAQEIVSIINFAKQNNKNYNSQSGDDYYVEVCIDGNSYLNKDLNEFLKVNKNSTFYSCNCDFNIRSIDNDNEKIIMSRLQGKDNNDIIYNLRTKLINKINFHTINNQAYSDALLKGYNVEIQ